MATPNKFVAYEDDNFRLALEVLGDNASFHCNVYKYSPSVYKRIVYVYSMIRDKLLDEGYNVMTYTTNPKFVNLIDRNFKPSGSFVKDGVKYEVFVWQKQ